MPTESATIVQRLWNYCNVLRDDGVSYGNCCGMGHEPASSLLGRFAAQQAAE